jgi:hypothetical protein
LPGAPTATSIFPLILMRKLFAPAVFVKRTVTRAQQFVAALRNYNGGTAG